MTYFSKDIQEMQELITEYDDLMADFAKESQPAIEKTGLVQCYILHNKSCIVLDWTTGLVREAPKDVFHHDILAAQRLLSIKRQLQSYKRQYSEG